MAHLMFVLSMALCAALLLALAALMIHIARKDTWRAQEVVVIEKLKRNALSDDFVAPLLARIPHSLPINAAWCALALQQGIGSEEFALRIKAYHAKFPKDEFGCVHYAMWLSHHGRYDEAEAILRAGRRRSPPNPLQTVTWIFRVHQDYAQAAERRQDWPAAIERWRVIQCRFSDLADGWIGESRAQILAGNTALAERAIDRALSISPKDHRCMRQHAEIAEQRGDWSEAARRWRVFRGRHEGAPEGYLRGAISAMRAGDTDAALRALDSACYLFPKDERTIAEASRIRTMTSKPATS